MIPTNQLCLDDFWDVGEALVLQHAINILLVVLAQLFRPEFPGLLVFLLEFLQPQFHAANASFVKAFGG